MSTVAAGAPGDPAGVPAAAASKSAPPPGVAAPYILIIDDQSRVGWNWAGALRRAGYRVSIAADADDGWHALEGDSYALLIASQDAIRHTALDLIRRARTVPVQIPCILIWEKTAPDVADVAAWLPPGTALEKPVAIAKLLATVRELLRAGEHPPAVIPPAGIVPFPVAV